MAIRLWGSGFWGSSMRARYEGSRDFGRFRVQDSRVQGFGCRV